MIALVEYKRAGLTESRKFGSVSWVSGKKNHHICGSNLLFYSRSTAKPMHLKVFAKDLEDVLSWEEKAVSVASHNAEPFHLKVIEPILRKNEKKCLRVPPSMPLNGNPHNYAGPQQIYHACSGEHSALIRACVQKNWNLENYTSLEHPFHLGFLQYIQSVLGEGWLPEFVAKDGCGLATLSLTLNELASLYANLAREKDHDWIWEAMVRKPELVGGTSRLDTTILKSCKGKVIAKEGAEGVLGMSIIDPEHPEGLGIAIKLEHGHDSLAMWHIARGILATLGWEIPLPPKLFRQEVLLRASIVPGFLQPRLSAVHTRDLNEELDDRW